MSCLFIYEERVKKSDSLSGQKLYSVKFAAASQQHVFVGKASTFYFRRLIREELKDSFGHGPTLD